MSRRIDIELTSALGDGTWTWRAAGARQPKGVVDSSVLPAGSKVGDELKVEVDQEIDGITVLGVVQAREKTAPAVIELLPAEQDFQPVVETRAKRDRNDRGGRGSRDGDRRPRRDRDDRGRDKRSGSGDSRGRDTGSRPDGGRSDGRGDPRRRDGQGGRRGPSFTPPPEVPQRPKPKRLRPGKAHRNAVLAELPEEQRAIAELALQGLGAVRQRVREENDRAAAEGRPPMPEASVMKMAEELLPKLRLAEWFDRAEAAQRQMEHLDLRDLRSVVAASGDPTVARDEAAVALAGELKAALAHKQEQELVLWFGDVDAALAVGRVIRALRLSSQPPKAGVPFPVDIAQRLADSVNASLAPMDTPERWAAMLEAAAFSPVRSLVKPARRPDVVSDELMATLKRLAPALPQVAVLFEIEVDPKAPMPKPLRTNPRQRKDGESGARRRDKARQSPNDRGAKRSDTAPPKAEQHVDAASPKAKQHTDDEASSKNAVATPPADTSPGETPTVAGVPTEASTTPGVAPRASGSAEHPPEPSDELADAAEMISAAAEASSAGSVSAEVAPDATESAPPESSVASEATPPEPAPTDDTPTESAPPEPASPAPTPAASTESAVTSEAAPPEPAHAENEPAADIAASSEQIDVAAADEAAGGPTAS